MNETVGRLVVADILTGKYSVTVNLETIEKTILSKLIYGILSVTYGIVGFGLFIF